MWTCAWIDDGCWIRVKVSGIAGCPATQGGTLALRNEIARRDQLDQQIALLKQECQAMGNEWSAATKNFVQCDAERLDLVREVQSLRSELEAWQFAYQDLSGVVRQTSLITSANSTC